MARIVWYYRRLRAMDVPELLWRGRRAVSSRLSATGSVSSAPVLRDGSGDQVWEAALASYRTGAGRPVFLDRRRARGISAKHPKEVAQLLEAADRAIDLTVWFPGYPEITLSRPLDWRYDAISGQQFPDLPSSRINHRDLPGDVGWMWRLHRLQHLPWLAQAWLFTGDERYSIAAFEHLDGWIEQNPPGRGIAWCGGFEPALRAIAIALALQGFRDAPQLTPGRFRRIVGVMAESAKRCWEDRSLYSSANNHLIGEMAGLATIAIMFPEVQQAQDWERDAVRILSVEAGKVVLADGAGAEQSVCYQMFTGDLLHLVAALLAQRDGSAPQPLVDAISRSSSYLASLIGGGDPAPRYGDDDEGFALRFGTQSARTVHDHLAMIAASGWCPDGMTVGSECLDAQWFGALAAARPNSPAAAGPPDATSANNGSFVAREGGLVVLRSQGRRITMDTGPLGYLSTAAHGHADALAVTLSEHGDYLIGDPGTGSFYGPGWRSVARGTSAHATVCVDGQDQSIPGGPYLWLRHAKVRILGKDLERGVIDAQHDGYTRLAGRVMHRRWLVAPPDERTQIVIDLIAGDGTHSCQQSWPMHPNLDAEPLDGGYLVRRGISDVLSFHFAASAPLTTAAVRGDEATNTGWWADPAEGRSPAWWLSARSTAELPIVMVALISPADDIVIEGLSVTLSGDRIESRWTEAGQRHTLSVDVAKPATVSLNRCRTRADE